MSSKDDTYISSVFMSAATHEPAVAVAVPVHGESETVGYWVAIINLYEVERERERLLCSPLGLSAHVGGSHDCAVKTFCQSIINSCGKIQPLISDTAGILSGKAMEKAVEQVKRPTAS